MDKDNKNDPPDDKGDPDIKKDIKRSTSKAKNTAPNSTESQIRRTFFGSRRRRKGNDKKEVKNNRSLTETDAGLRNPPTNEIGGSGEAPKGALMVTEPHAEEYFMNHPQRGKAVIFNHETFNNEEPREGTKIDVERIKKVFGELLKFEVVEYHDLEYHEIMGMITQLSKDDHTNSDCLAIFVLTHGRKGGEISAKDIYYPLDKLWEYFAGEKCVTLAGKPKLFFISACRGRKKDSGIRFFRGGRTQTDSSNKQMSYKIPNQADFLIAKSTVEGYYSYRDVQNGTWFIQCLCDVISQYYETKDLMKILTITSRKVAIDFRTISDRVEDDGQTQIPAITTMLIRDVYFRNKEAKSE